MISAVSGDILFKYMCLSSNNSCNVSVLKCWDQSECVFDLVYHMCLFVFVIDIIIFCLTGTVLIYTSADEPVTAIARLKLKHCNSPSVSVGHYRLSGEKVCALKLTLCLWVKLKLRAFFFFKDFNVLNLLGNATFKKCFSLRGQPITETFECLST